MKTVTVPTLASDIEAAATAWALANPALVYAVAVCVLLAVCWKLKDTL